jgi:trans-2-enoyl-CoA reductase
VELLAAAINPADLNMVEGVYPVGPAMPAVGGSEGVFKVVQVGKNVQGLKEGDWVIPSAPGAGTWATHRVGEAKGWTRIDNDIPPEYAALIAVNPCSALRMLNDFVALKEGDVVIQNGANSAVGQAVIQLAHLRGIRTINVIRSRPDFAETVERMKVYGAYAVVDDSMLGTAAFRELLSDLPAPKLALNCVGGPSATELVRSLAEGGTMVTYGGMSRKPVVLPTGSLIFKDVQLRGFWLTKWLERHSEQERAAMIKEIYSLIKQQKFRMWIERYSLTDEWKMAFARATGAQRNRKVVVVAGPGGGRAVE